MATLSSSDSGTKTEPMIGGSAEPNLSWKVDVEMGALSHQGKLRTRNEDNYLVARFDRSMQTVSTNLPRGYVPERAGETTYGMLVADGMGGHAAGEIASQEAIRKLIDLVLHTPDWIMRMDDELVGEVIRRMQSRFREVSKFVRDMAAQNSTLHGMGTTLTVACSLGVDMVIGHVGDSRVYLHRRGKLHRLTRDQTMAQLLLEAGEIREKDLATHPLRHVLTAAIGSATHDIKAEIDRVHLQHGDQILLCTDGLSEMVNDSAIAESLSMPGTVDEACQRLVDLALAGGGKDNVTVVLSRYKIQDL